MQQRPRVVIIGGGFGGVQAAKALKNLPIAVTLVDRRNIHLFQPLLYQVAMAGLSPGNIAASLRGHLRHWDLSQGQFDLLAEIAADEGLNQQTCADRLSVTKGNVTQHMNNLEIRGFIEREKLGRDNHIFLTDAGRALFSMIMPAHDTFVKEILAPLTQEEVQQFAAILRKLDRSID